MNLLDRLMVQHAHPVKFVLEILGYIWGIYFLWQNNLVWALVLGLGLPILGTILAWGRNESALASTALGKIMLMHAHPANFSLHVIGFFPLVYGIWIHATIYILIGVSIITIGHLWGWDRVK